MLFRIRNNPKKDENADFRNRKKMWKTKQQGSDNKKLSMYNNGDWC